MALCGPRCRISARSVPGVGYLPLCPHQEVSLGLRYLPTLSPGVGYLPTLSPVGGVPRSGASPHSVPSWRCPWVWGISPFCPQLEVPLGLGYLPILSPVSDISPFCPSRRSHSANCLRPSFRISLPRQPECRCLKGHHGPHSRFSGL